MTVIKEVLYTLHQRLKDLAIDAPADQLAYLAKALESIAGQGTVYDIVNISDERLKELLDAANAAKTTALSAIDSAKTTSIDEINTNRETSLTTLQRAVTTNLSLLDTRRDANIEAINTAQIDVSTIMTEIGKKNMIESGSLPIIFAVLSRKNDPWGYGDLTSQLGQWCNSNADKMLQLLTGVHSYTTEYGGFYKPPQLYFLQGTAGNFIYKEMYLRYADTSNEYTYPYAGLGAIFVKNTTANDITRKLSFGGSSYWSSGYEGMGLFVATADDTGLNWTNLYSYSSSTSNNSSSANVTVPAGKTAVILFYTSAYYHTNNYNYYVQFIHWYIFKFRSEFLTNGLEVDVEKTLKAWQCRGFQNTYEIWR